MSFLWTEKVFKRALAFSFSRKKFFLTFLVLFLSGLFFLGLQILPFTPKGLGFFSQKIFPYFLSLFFFIPLGVLLCKSYAFEVQGKVFSWRKYLESSWEKLLFASLFAFPFLLGFILLWLILGMVSVAQLTPFFPNLLSSLFFFVPFSAVFLLFLLGIISVGFLFTGVPLLAFCETKKKLSLLKFLQPWQKSPLQTLFLLFFALAPLTILLVLWQKAFFYANLLTCLETPFFFFFLQGFILNLCRSFLFSVGVIFFFHMAVEAFSLRIKS